MGQIEGKLILKTQGNSLSGSITALGMKSDFTGGTIMGNQCQFAGVIQTMMGNIQYEAKGTVQNGKMNLSAKTNMGNFEFVGERQ